MRGRSSGNLLIASRGTYFRNPSMLSMFLGENLLNFKLCRILAKHAPPARNVLVYHIIFNHLKV